MVEGNALSPRETRVNPDIEAYLSCTLSPENVAALSGTFQRGPVGTEPTALVFAPIDYSNPLAKAPPPVQETRQPLASTTEAAPQRVVIVPAAEAPPVVAASVDTRGVSTKDLLSAGNPEPVRKTADRSNFYISQVKDSVDPSGWFACGPTSLLNALGDWGLSQPTEANRQALIDEVVPGSNTSTRALGQFPGGPALMAQWARAKGLNAEDHSGDLSVDSIDKAIAEGKGVILNAPNHFVYIVGKDAQGRYVVADPSYPSTEYWDRATVHNKLNGGAHFGFTTVWRGNLNGPREVTA